MLSSRLNGCLYFLLLSIGSFFFLGQSAEGSGPRARITRAVVDGDTVTLAGNVHPLTRKATLSAPADPGTRMDDLILYFQPSAKQEAELEQLVAQQSDRHSRNYQRFLSPQEFAARFGASPEDILVASNWLQRYGLKIERVSEGNGSIVFSGTADQVSNAFKTEMWQYTYRSERYLANASDPQIPAAFAGVVGGVVKLHDFQHQSFHARSAEAFPVQAGEPQYSPLGLRWLTPGDYSVIYDINPLLNSGIDGTGQSIAVIARSNIYLSDIQSFRSMFGLKANDPQIIVTNSNPGQVNGDNIETTLDTEWAGAVAPGAAIKVIVSASGSSRDGIDLSSLYAVTNKVAPIITVSYGSCEAAMGSTELSFYNSLWQQASAQGQTVLVASGDSGVAGCDGGGSAKATHGKGVNGLCSSPYSTCVGGTQFVEGNNPGQYWFPSDPSSTAPSAMSYIPEAVWNESATVSGGSGLWAGGGGASSVYAKPAWQTGTGVPSDKLRDVPDVSLTAASHDGYTVIQGGTIGFIFGVGGTSASTPSFAGIMALVDQQTNSPQGNINATLYTLAAQASKQGAAIFHDVTAGNNSVPGQAGFSATAGYDQASGLGSVDANLLATLWNTASNKPATLTVSASALKVNVGQNNSTTVTTITNNLNSSVNLSVSGVPAGLTATLSSTSIASPGAGTVTLKVAAASSVTPGVYSLALNATSGSLTATSSVAVTVTAATFTLSYSGGTYPTLNFGPNPPYAPQKVAFQTFPAGGFNSSIAFSATGMPSGMTVSFSPSAVSGSSVASTTATVSVANTVKGGSYNFTVSATGGGVTQKVTYLALVYVQPSCTLTPNQYSASFKAGLSTTFNLACTASKAATTPVSLSISGLPGGVTAKFSSSTVTPTGVVTLTLSSTSAVTPGTYPLTVTGSESSGATQTLWLYAAISTPVFTLSLNPATITSSAGSTAQFKAVVTPDSGFSSPVTVWIGGAPNGVSASVGANSIANPSSVITLTVSKSAVRGTYQLNVGASAATGYSRSLVATLTIK